MIQAIVYDAVGTLIHVQPAVAEIYAEVGRRFGSRLAADDIRRRFHAAFARQDLLDEQAGWHTTEEREYERWRAIVAEVLDDVADGDGCFAALFAIFGQPASWACDSEVTDVLAEFKRRGLRQALASNFDRRLHAVTAAMPAIRHLDHIIVSSAIGWRKPAAEFFTHVVDLLQLPPAAILFVGDDRSNDFEAARHAGMRSVLFDPRKKHLDIADRIERLSEVLGLT